MWRRHGPGPPKLPESEKCDYTDIFISINKTMDDWSAPAGLCVQWQRSVNASRHGRAHRPSAHTRPSLSIFARRHDECSELLFRWHETVTHGQHSISIFTYFELHTFPKVTKSILLSVESDRGHFPVRIFLWLSIQQIKNIVAATIDPLQAVKATGRITVRTQQSRFT